MSLCVTFSAKCFIIQPLPFEVADGQQVLPVLTAAGISVTIRHTMRAGHALQLAKLAQPGDENFDGIICCGGDGHIAQIQQSNLTHRRLPIAVVPLGVSLLLSFDICLSFVLLF